MHAVDPRRQLPAVEGLLRELGPGPAAPRKHCARLALALWRERLAGADGASPDDPAAAVLATARGLLARLEAEPLPPVINATGTVLHTGLGRAPLSARARSAAARVLEGYCQLEFDLASGKRGDRQGHVAPLLCALTGAEAALVVNNCAGATVLLLQALAQHRAVLVSRGELVEIGGSFRIPEIMACAGCRLVEVGATNKTHRRDYEQAIAADTALLLKVHRSNFVQQGFTAEVATADLVALGREHGLPVAVDQGSGNLCDLQALGYATGRVMDELAAGADLVACSGDKLLGGPQAGILLGSRAAIQRCARHPLARALRCDKVTLAALAGTLQDHLLDDPLRCVPTLRMLGEDPQRVRERAEALLAALAGRLDCALCACRGAVGSGALPTEGPASWALVPRLADPETAHRHLRAGSPAVVGRISDGRLLIDCATVADEQVAALAERLAGLAS